ncbi:MAG: hypothetical protein IPL30_07555 [Elusimicrobia bacterium]|nr:hypothetical protein [Elusimicrobiota bacterium]
MGLRKTKAGELFATGLVLGAAYGLPGVGAAALLTYFSPERPFGPPAVARRTTDAFLPSAPRLKGRPGRHVGGAEALEDFKSRVREFYDLFETEVVNKFAGKTIHDVDVPNAFYNQRAAFLDYFNERIKELPGLGEALNAEAEAGLADSVTLRDRLITMLGYLQVFARDAEGREHSPTAGVLFNISRALFGKFHFPEHETSSLDQLINALTLRRPIVMVLTDVALDTDTMISTAMEVRRRRLLNPHAVFVPVINGDFIPAEARHLLGNALADDFLFPSVRALAGPGAVWDEPPTTPSAWWTTRPPCARLTERPVDRAIPQTPHEWGLGRGCACAADFARSRRT